MINCTFLKAKILTAALLLATVCAFAQQNYYIDAVAGNDGNLGTSVNSAWKNLTKLNALTVAAGSTINLKCGSVWTGQQLKFLGSGSSGKPIVVNQYGSGAKPILHGNGFSTADQGVVYLYNQKYIEINNLEITNDPAGPADNHFFVGLYNTAVTPNPNPTGGDRRGVTVVLKNLGLPMVGTNVASHIYLKNLNIHHVKGQLGSGETTVNGAIPKRTGGIYFTVLDETSGSNSRFDDVLIDSCTIAYCENIGVGFDNEDNIYYPGGASSSVAADVTEYNNWFARRYSKIKISNNTIHHIGKNAMIIRCADSTGLIERNVCYETAQGTTGNTMFTARCKGTVFQYNEGYYNRGTTQNVDPGTIDGSMYDADFGSVGVIFQHSYSHDNSEGIYWGCNSRSATNNTSGSPDPGDKGCTLRYCVSKNDMGDLIFFNYPSAGNEIYNNVFYIKSGLNANIIHESSTKEHGYNFYNNIVYNLSSSAGFALANSVGDRTQTRSLSNNVFYNVANIPTEMSHLPTMQTTDPQFFSLSSTVSLGINSLGGFKLKPTSPALASGKIIANNGGQDYYGTTLPTTAPNRGVYEGAGFVVLTTSISSFSPTSGINGTTVTIKGNNFTGTSAVSFGGVSATAFNVVSDTVITATIGNGATGNIVIINDGKSVSSSNSFSFCTPPNAPSASGVSVCSGNTASLTATATGTIGWYSAATGGTYLGGGNSFTSLALSATKVYYAQDSTCAASATRSAVAITVLLPSSSTTTTTACNDFLWNGVLYTSSGIKLVHLTNAAGCDSAATLNLTLKQATSSTTSVSICASVLPYSFNGLSFTEAGTQTAHILNAAGCDSAATLNLTLKQPSSSTTAVSICTSALPFSFNGLTFTTAGTQTAHILNAAGCDSAATLILSLKQATSSNTSLAVCATALPYRWNGLIFTTSGTQTAHILNAAGCDSAATLNLSLKQATSSSNSLAICASALPYSWNGLIFTTAGTQTAHILNAAGCDSAATLVLSVGKALPINAIKATLVSNLCGARVYQYEATAANAIGYSWTIPTSLGNAGTVSVDSGDIKQSQVIRLKYSSNLAALATDSIKVMALSNCGNSDVKGFKLIIAELKAPAVPASITISPVVTNVCGARTYLYTAPSLPLGTATTGAAAGYAWSFTGTLGQNATIDAGSFTTQLLRMKYTSNAAAAKDSVKLYYTSACGNSPVRISKLSNLALSVPAVPKSITITPVVTNVCGARTYLYTAPSLPLATTTAGAAEGYAWSFAGTLGQNASIDSGSFNTQVLRMKYTSNAAATTDSVKLYYTSACGNSAVKTLKLSNIALVTTAPKAIAATLVSDACGARIYRYTATGGTATITAVAATGYQWTLPAFGAAVKDSGDITSDNSIKVKYATNIASATNDVIGVQAKSDCGLSTVKTVAIGIKAKTGCSALREITATAASDVSNFSTARIYPNPSNGNFTISFQSKAKAGIATIELIGAQGNVLRTVKIPVNSDGSVTAQMSVKGIASGMYQARYRVGNESRNLRLVIVK